MGGHPPQNHLRLGLIGGHFEQYEQSLEFRTWVDSMETLLRHMSDRMSRACTLMDVENGFDKYIAIRESPPPLIIKYGPGERTPEEVVGGFLHGKNMDE